MSRTDTMITLPNVRADQKFYREIGRHFVMAGFRQPPVNAEIMNTRTRPVPQEPVRWPPQKSVMMRKDTMLMSEYSVSERARSSFLVHVFFSECMTIGRLYICSNVEGNRICYEEEMFPKSGKHWKPEIPVAYDGGYREFHLMYADGSGMTRIALLRNCLCCGGVFPCSWRDSRFGRPSEDERQKFREIGWAAGSLDEVAEVLGKSDFHLGSVIYGRKKLNAEKGIRDMAVYTDISDDAVVIFKEYNQGMIITNYAGKWQGGS